MKLMVSYWEDYLKGIGMVRRPPNIKKIIGKERPSSRDQYPVLPSETEGRIGKMSEAIQF